MAMATVLSRAQLGMEAPLVRVEIDLSPGLPRFAIVGLAEAAVKESRDRVRAAIVNSDLTMPEGRVTANLSPADLPKEGGRYDLPIALGILLASDQLPAESLRQCEFFGELSLGGEVQGMHGALLAAVAATRDNHSLVIPRTNASEAALVSGCKFAVVSSLLQVVEHAKGAAPLEFTIGSAPPIATRQEGDLAEVRGQESAKRALEIAAAGAHSLIFLGPPGTGKSMLAQRLPGLLPPLSEGEALEVAAVRSAAGMPIDTSQWRTRPFRSPHHTASAVALVGGGTRPRPGEISLAHRGVLFLDELPEFERRVLEVLRQPLETGVITISRAASQAEFPASFQLVGAMNPCPCGYLGDAISGKCHCTSEQVQRYRSRLSGPLIDRLDLHVEVLRVPHQVLRAENVTAETSAQVAARVVRVRELQLARQGCVNARLIGCEVERVCRPTARGRQLLERASNKLGFSARAYHRVLKVARTIADIVGAANVDTMHISEALALRKLDRTTSALNEGSAAS